MSANRVRPGGRSSSIARRLGELMNGSIELDLPPGRTRFALVLPGATEDEPFSREKERLEEPSLQ